MSIENEGNMFKGDSADYLNDIEIALMRTPGALDAYHSAIENQREAIEHLLSLADDQEKTALKGTLYRMIAEGVGRAYVEIHNAQQGETND